MPRIAPLPTGIAALALAACGVAGAASMQGGPPPAPAPAARTATPVTCALVLHDSGGSVAVTARLTATAAAQGSYALRISQTGSGGSSQIVQGGDFVAAAGQTVTLSESNLSGRARDLTATLSLDIAGRSIDCPATAE